MPDKYVICIYFFFQKDEDFEVRPIVGSATVCRSVLKDGPSSPIPRRALFNPFNPLQMFAPLTANRRRWVHTYPRGPQGEALVLHHRNSSMIKVAPHQNHEGFDDESGLVQSFGSSISPSDASRPVASSPVAGIGQVFVLHVLLIYLQLSIDL